MNLAALLRSTYVESLCNRVGPNRGRGKDSQLMWILCLRGSPYKRMIYFSGKLS